MLKFVAAALGVAALLVAAAPYVAAAQTVSSSPGFSALEGRKLPGTGNAWWPIGTVTPHGWKVGDSVATLGTSNDASSSHRNTLHVVFLNFKDPGAATAFYQSPSVDIGLAISGDLTADYIVGIAPLDGATGIPDPARGLEIRSCLREDSGAEDTQIPSGESQCPPSDVPASIGTAIMLQRGKVIVMVERDASNTTDVRGMTTWPAPTTNDLVQETPYAQKALTLLHKVKLA